MPSYSAGAADFTEGTLINALNTTATTGVTVKSIEVNGSSITWPTVAHRLFIVQKTRTKLTVEKVDVASGTTQSGSTVTLGTITRGLSLTDGTSFASGTGLSFAASAKVYLATDAQFWEQAFFKDIQNTMTGSGQITSSSTTTAAIRFNPVTTTQRDAISASNGDVVYNSTTGEMNQYVGGAWVAIGNTGTANASTTAAGKVEEATAAEVGAGTAAGGSGAQLYINPASVVKTSSGAGDENNLAALGSSGTLAVGFLGTGSPSASTTLTGDGAWTTVAAGTPLFGDGSDGSPTWTSGATLTNTGEFEYTTATLPVSQTVTVSTANTPLRIKTTGDVTINGTLDLNSLGGAGGAGTSSTNTNGTAGTAGLSMISGSVTGVNGGSGGGYESGTSRGGGGGGGASMYAAGTVGETNNGAAGGAGGTITAAPWLAVIASMMRGVVCGAGGAGGGRANTGTSGAGGIGGGAAIWYIGGDLTLGASSTIQADGLIGVVATTAGGSGGGGGGGSVLLVVGGSITDGGVTLTAAGGGSAASVGAGGAAGGPGAAGKIIIYSLQDGTLITS